MNKIKRLFAALSGVEGMEAIKNNKASQGAFYIMLNTKKIGILKRTERQWEFKYTEEYKKNPETKPLVDFPDISKEYANEELWPFFRVRIPALNQSFHKEKIKKAKIDENDPVGLLRLFGKKTITNPYILKSI
jgi:HipA-like protein